jgi:hypothetical protein
LSAELGRPVSVDDIEAGRVPPPRVLDPFSGGGSYPLEALRLGCDAYANDYNPVAALILKATLEYPQRFGVKRTRIGLGNRTRMNTDGTDEHGLGNRTRIDMGRIGTDSRKISVNIRLIRVNPWFIPIRANPWFIPNASGRRRCSAGMRRSTPCWRR